MANRNFYYMDNEGFNLVLTSGVSFLVNKIEAGSLVITPKSNYNTDLLARSIISCYDNSSLSDIRFFNSINLIIDEFEIHITKENYKFLKSWLDNIQENDYIIRAFEIKNEELFDKFYDIVKKNTIIDYENEESVLMREVLITAYNVIKFINKKLVLGRTFKVAIDFVFKNNCLKINSEIKEKVICILEKYWKYGKKIEEALKE